MESNGRPGFVNVSENVKNLVETMDRDYYNFEVNREVFISNTNETIKSFLIHKGKSKN